MGEAKTERQLAAASEKWTQALLAVLQDYSVPDIDSGVQDKWDGTAKTQPSGSGTQDDPYQIGTAAQLAWFADKVNGTKSSSRACAVLTADIDLNRQDGRPSPSISPIPIWAPSTAKATSSTAC